MKSYIKFESMGNKSFNDDYKTGKKRALRLLNHRKPENPPSVFFLRKNPEFLA